MKLLFSSRRRWLAALLVVGATASVSVATPALAQAWPTKPVRIVVPFAAGGSTDVIARMLGQRLTEKWGQAVVIENRGGAGGNLGADLVAKAAPDGYTFLMASGSITINPNLYAKMPFDTRKDLVPVSNVAGGPMLVVVSARSPIKTTRELIAAAKANPGAMSYGSAGVGSQTHLAVENFADVAGIDMQHVPYKGEAPAYTDLISGQTQMMIGNIAAAAALLGPDRLRAVAVTGKERSPLLPDVPTVAESGLPGFENTGWFGLLAPAGTPAAIIDKMYRDTAAVLSETQFKARLYVLGMAPIGSSPAEFGRQIDGELKRWAQVVKNRKLSAN